MSNPSHVPLDPKQGQEEKIDRGTNIVLIYCLIGVALILAIGFAVMIVLPFYHRR
jgi:hypothetical protein